MRSKPAGDAALNPLPPPAALDEVLREGARDACRVQQVGRNPSAGSADAGRSSSRYRPARPAPAGVLIQRGFCITRLSQFPALWSADSASSSSSSSARWASLVRQARAHRPAVSTWHRSGSGCTVLSPMSPDRHPYPDSDHHLDPNRDHDPYPRPLYPDPMGPGCLVGQATPGEPPTLGARGCWHWCPITSRPPRWSIAWVPNSSCVPRGRPPVSDGPLRRQRLGFRPDQLDRPIGGEGPLDGLEHGGYPGYAPGARDLWVAQTAGFNGTYKFERGVGLGLFKIPRGLQQPADHTHRG